LSATANHGVLADVNRLESLPQVVIKALELIHDPRSTPQQLAAVLSLDQGLAARVLALATSAFFGTTRRSLSLREALVRVGLNTVRSLVMTAAVAPSLEHPLPGYGLDRGQLWRHSVACAVCARHLAVAVGYRDREDAYIAGLLHDIGKPVLDRHVGVEFAQALQLARQQHIAVTEAERMVIGFDHAQIGEIVLEKWQLSATLAEAVGRHHNPLTTPSDSLLPHIVHVADAITHMLGIGIGGDGLNSIADYQVVRTLGLDVERVEQLMEQLGDSLKEVDSLLRLDDAR
jgi:putative nucleotidyltransferase with HDIG domain